MTTVELTTDNFDQVLQTDRLVLIDFWAAWCGPYRAFAPVFERVSERHTDAVFGKVDTEAWPQLAARFAISAIPTLMVMSNGVVRYAQPGALGERALEDLITQAQTTDMDDVQRQLNRRAS
ncbi:MAG: thiol reductase thioredoxin [Longispora sp.]|nr:thiol reductase thioredoxin [Longispora sp. (in: high G+C Gram-positive bacteria)]